MGHVNLKIEELDFDDDPEIIIAYHHSERFCDRNLEGFINVWDDEDN
jgi:hypothetical protein